MYLINISVAGPADVTSLNTLINGAYRGEGSKKGWTTEADLLGGIRTNETILTDLIAQPGAALLIARNEEGSVIGCMYLQKQTDTLYLGMLTVSPSLQAGGIGKQLLHAAEDHAKKEDIDSISMTVISVRHELIAWYERHGYAKTGETKPFPTDPTFGIPRQPLEFVVMKKKLREQGEKEG
ncbi:MAG: GNAT family N-acetyltransferase [Chitinophagaceae bacterium]